MRALLFMVMAVPAAAQEAALTTCRGEGIAEALCQRLARAEDAVTLPVALPRLDLISAMRVGPVLRYEAKPALGGTPPDPADVTAFVCTTPALAEAVAAGARVDVVINEWSFATVEACGVP